MPVANSNLSSMKDFNIILWSILQPPKQLNLLITDSSNFFIWALKASPTIFNEPLNTKENIFMTSSDIYFSIGILCYIFNLVKAPSSSSISNALASSSLIYSADFSRGTLIIYFSASFLTIFSNSFGCLR